MIGVFIIPTGIGCEIGGHAGDATPAARLIGACCDTLVLHPNVVNASDINEMPHNSLYVEGSMLDKFLEGEIELQRVHSNRVLVAVNAPVRPETINAVSAARATLGLDAEIVELKSRLEMIGRFDDVGRATGGVLGWQKLVEQVREYDFDALAIATQITVPKETALRYFRTGGVNPWGGVEAIASKLISGALGKPVAHAPVETDDQEMKAFNEVVNPRRAAECISLCYLHCVLKGLHKAPRIGKGLSVDDIDCLITPLGCAGPPHRACLERGIPVIAVRENTCVLNDSMPAEFTIVESYLEAAGYLMAMQAGVSPAATKRPLTPTRTHLHKEPNDEKANQDRQVQARLAVR